MIKIYEVKDLELWPPRTGQFSHTKEAEALMDQSLQRFGAFPKFVGRPHPKKPGKVQIPFGGLTLPRIIAMFGPDYKVPVQVGQRSNEEMLRLCDIENSDAWHNLPLNYVEVIDAILTAHATGELVFGTRRNLTGADIAGFLGGDWVRPDGRPADRIYWCLNAVELMKSGDLKAEDLAGLGVRQAETLVEEIARRTKQRAHDAELAEKAARRAEAEAAAAGDESAREAARRRQAFEESRAENHRRTGKSEIRRIAGIIAPKLRARELGTRDVRREAEAIAPTVTPSPKALPWLYQATRQLAHQLDQILAGDDHRLVKLNSILDHGYELDRISEELLAGSLHALAGRASKLAARLGHPKSRPTADANPKKLQK